DLIGVSAYRIGMTLDNPDEPLHLGRVGIGHVPHVGVLRDQLQQHALAVPADHQRNIFLNRLRITYRVDDVVMLAFQRRLVLAEHPLDYLARLVERFEALRDSLKSKPRLLCSSSNHPAPRPRLRRPPLIWSSVAAIFA